MRRKRNKKQVRLAVGLSIFFLLFMAVGYAAFNTNLTITAKGNIKDVYHLVHFKNNLIEGSTFENTDDWLFVSNSIATIDTRLKYKNHNTLRVYEKDATAWSGVNSKKIISPYKFNQLYEISVMVYRDSASEFGDLNTVFRGYTPNVNVENPPTWNGYLCSYNHYINIDASTLPDRTWKEYKAYFATPTQGNCEYFERLRLDYDKTNKNISSNLWIALPSFYEITQKEVKKYNKIGSLPVATKEGYIFAGWYTDEYEGTKIDENFEITKDIDFYARFTKEN